MKSIVTLSTVVLILLLSIYACKQEDDSVADIVGTWFGSNLEFPPNGLTHVDAKSTINADGTYETLLYDVGGSTLQDFSNRGTYSCSNNIIYSTTTEIYDQGSWTSTVETYETPYSVSGDTLTLYQDWDEDGKTDATWILTRQ